MKKLLDIFSSGNLFGLFLIATVMYFVTMLELRFLSIPREKIDGLWLANIILTIAVYLFTKWLEAKEQGGLK